MTTEKGDRYEGLAEQLLEETDRGFAILIGQEINDQLEYLLRLMMGGSAKKKAINGLFSGFGPVSSFAAKIEVLYALGALPDKVYQQIQIVRKIRNLFAHIAGPVSFADPRVMPHLIKLDGVGTRFDDEGFITVKVRGAQKELSRKEFVQRAAFALSTQKILGRISAQIALYEHAALDGEQIWTGMLRGNLARLPRILPEENRRGEDKKTLRKKDA